MEYTNASKRNDQYTPFHRFVATEHIFDLDTVNYAYPERTIFFPGHDGGVDMKNEDCTTAADIILTISGTCSKFIAEELLKFLFTMGLTAADFQAEHSSLKTCEENLGKQFQKSMSAMHRKMVVCSISQNDLNGEQHVLFMGEPIELLRVQLKLANPNDIMMRPRVPGVDGSTIKDDNGVSEVHTMDKLYTKEIYACVREHVMGSIDSSALCTDSIRSAFSSFVGMLQIYTDRTAATLKWSVAVAYPVQVVLLNFLKDYCRYLIDHVYTFVGLLLEFAAVSDHNRDCDEPNDAGSELASDSVIPLADKLPQTSDKIRRSVKIAFLHWAMQKILFYLSACVENGVDVSVCEKAWKCHPVIISYCRDIPEEKDMSGVKHGTTAHSCVRCLASEEDILCLRLGRQMYRRDMQQIYIDADRLAKQYT